MSLKALGLSPTASLAEVKVRWRELAREHHPDRGGNPVEFTTAQAQYQAALKEVAEPLSCPTCGGTGIRALGTGWNLVKLPCLTCHGSKVIPRPI